MVWSQPLLIGLFLGGDFDKLAAHAALGRRDLAAIDHAAVPGRGAGLATRWAARLGGGGRPRPWSVGAVVQIAAGYQRNLGLHVPLGVALAAAVLGCRRPRLVACAVAVPSRAADRCDERFSRRDFFGIAGGAGLVAATASLGLLKLGPSCVDRHAAAQRSAPAAAVLAAADGAADRRRRRPEPTATVVHRAVANAEIIPGLPHRDLGITTARFPGPTILRQVRPAGHRRRAQRTAGAHRGAPARRPHPGRVRRLPHRPDPARRPSRDWHPTRLTGNAVIGRPRSYRYPLQQRASTLWYHDHTMDFTGPNVYRGLAGFFLVGDDEDDALPLPRGDRDLPLMVCDRSFAADGSFRYPALSADQSAARRADRLHGRGSRRCRCWSTGCRGRGTRWMAPATGCGCSMRPTPAGSSSRSIRRRRAARPFVQIAGDGGLLAAPVARDSVTLASAERAEVVVDFAAYPVGSTVTLVNRLGAGTTAVVLRFHIVRAAADDTAIPRRALPDRTARPGRRPRPPGPSPSSCVVARRHGRRCQPGTWQSGTTVDPGSGQP